MLFEIAAEVRQIGKAAKLSSLTNGERLVREKVFRLIEAHLYQIIMRCAAEKLFIIGLKLAFFHIGPLAKLFHGPFLFIVAQHGKAQLLKLTV